MEDSFRFSISISISFSLSLSFSLHFHVQFEDEAALKDPWLRWIDANNQKTMHTQSTLD
jgi:hypothetical protein